MLSRNVPVKPQPKVVGATNWEPQSNRKGCSLALYRLRRSLRRSYANTKCQACGVGQNFRTLHNRSNAKVSTEPIRVVIIGSGIAAVSAVDAIRERNSATAYQFTTMIECHTTVNYCRWARMRLMMKSSSSRAVANNIKSHVKLNTR